MEQYPLLQGAAQGFYPQDGRCPMCQSHVGSHGTLTYVSGGALLLDDEGDSVHTDRLRGFLHLGCHTAERGDSCGVDISLVDDLHEGQFDLQFCSLACLRRWLNSLVDQLEADLAELPEGPA